MSRQISRDYSDPLDLIWLRAAADLGWEVRRSQHVYASWDGRSVLTVSTSDDFDADDSLAQLLFHEMCHALVAGPHGMAQEDWGLSNIDDGDIASEYATHRLQAALAAPYGLREFFAVTTDHRVYWDGLPRDTLRLVPNAPELEQTAIALAQRGFTRARQRPFAKALELALEATATLAQTVRPVAPPSSLWRLARERHVTGFPMPLEPSNQCGSCAWAQSSNSSSEGSLVCLQARHRRPDRSAIEAGLAACERWEARFGIEDCGDCGACCREGFDLVQVRSRDAVLERHPEWVTESTLGLHIPRPTGRCPGLAGGDGLPYRCTDYEFRPSSCRDFEVGEEACLEARRRVGLSQ